MTKIETGQAGERQALDLLKEKGYKILETNFRTRFGEIDIVAQDQDTLVFCEVKTRSSNQFGLPEEAVGYRKLQRLLKTAAIYRACRKNLPESERVDVVAIETSSGRAELIKNVTG